MRKRMRQTLGIAFLVSLMISSIFLCARSFVVEASKASHSHHSSSPELKLLHLEHANSLYLGIIPVLASLLLLACVAFAIAKYVFGDLNRFLESWYVSSYSPPIPESKFLIFSLRSPPVAAY